MRTLTVLALSVGLLFGFAEAAMMPASALPLGNIATTFDPPATRASPLLDNVGWRYGYRGYGGHYGYRGYYGGYRGYYGGYRGYYGGYYPRYRYYGYYPRYRYYGYYPRYRYYGYRHHRHWRRW